MHGHDFDGFARWYSIASTADWRSPKDVKAVFGNTVDHVVAPFYDIYRDPREEYPVSTPVGAWAGSPFDRIIERHMAWKQRYPDAPPARDIPYSGIDNLRPETLAMREEWLTWKRQIGSME